MNIFATMGNQEIVFLLLLVCTLLIVGIGIGVHIIEKWAFDKAIRDWEKENPVAASNR